MDKMKSKQNTLKEEKLKHNTLDCMVCLKKHPINKISVIMDTRNSKLTCGDGGQRDNRDVNDTLDRWPRFQDIADVPGWTRSADHLYEEIGSPVYTPTRQSVGRRHASLSTAAWGNPDTTLSGTKTEKFHHIPKTVTMNACSVTRRNDRYKIYTLHLSKTKVN